MVYSHWSDYRAGSVARTRSVVQVPGFDVPVKLRRSFRVSLEALVTFVVFLAVASALAGCSTGAASSSSSSSQTPLIWVAMGQNPPGYMVTGTSTQVSAWVNNDAANAGVDWVVTCGNPGHCGSFSAAHSDSGLNTTFTAPTAVPPNSTLTISALSATDHSKSASVSVHINSSVTAIVITTAPQIPVPANATVKLSAIVFGDPANLGVDWTATCLAPSGPVDCSSPNFSSRFGATNNTIFFTVPSILTTPSGVVSLVGTQITITARPTADHSQYAQSSFTVTAPISISMTQPPPPTMLLKATAQVVAVVTNDTFGEGVTWSVKCLSASGDCGSITPTQTGSGVAVTYTAPTAVPSTPVTIEADATTTSLAVDCAQSIGSACQMATATVNVVAPISVSITQHVPNDAIIQNASAPLIATVSNDQANAGVDWTVNCGSAGACGTFSPAHTASGAATTYTAPSAPPAGSTVTITATSTADPTKSAQENVTVSSAPPLMQGQFVLYLNAKNSQNGPFVLGGVITGDGKGNIGRGTGHFELVDASGNATISIFVTSPSSYSIGSDGRGQMTLTIDLSALKSGRPTANFGVPVPGSTTTSTLTLSVVFVTQQLDPSGGVVLNEHALVTETDSFGDATGTLDLQNPADLASFSGGAAGLNGTYSMQLTGTQVAPQYPAFFEDAALSIQTSGGNCTITGYTADQSANGVITSVPFTTGSQVLPGCKADLNGEIFSNIPVNLGLPQQFNLNFWLIDKDHFVVTDPFDQPGGFALFGGYLTAQPQSPALSGTLAFTAAGATTASATTPGQPQVAGGIFTCGSTGSLDVVPLSGTAVTNQAVSTTCGAPTNGRGLITITGGGSAGISRFTAYPTTDGNFYLIELDGGAAGTSGPSGAGVAYQQTLSPPISASALSGKYGSQFSASTQVGSQAFTGQVISDGTSAISGTVDVNSFSTTASPPAGNPSTSATLSSGSFTAASSGRFPLTLTITPATGKPAPQIPTLNPACYIVDASTCLLLNLDPAAPGTGILQLQKNVP